MRKYSSVAPLTQSFHYLRCSSLTSTLAKLETLQQKEIEKAAQGMEASVGSATPLGHPVVAVY